MVKFTEMKWTHCIGTGVALALFLTSSARADDFDPLAREGVTHYNREEYDQATSKFEASQLDHPDNPDVAYNLANSQYRQGRFEEAVESFKKALKNTTTPPELRQKSYYNMGNAYYRMGYLDEAIDSYKQSLELRPTDMDSKFNLEWARKQKKSAHNTGRVGPRDKDILKQQATSQQPNNPGDPGDSRENGKAQDPSRQPEQPPDGDSTAKNSPDQKPGDSDSGSPSKPDTPSLPGDQHPTQEEVHTAFQEMTQMTPEEAERWLGSISEDLKKIKRRQMEGNVTDSFADHDKNW